MPRYKFQIVGGETIEATNVVRRMLKRDRLAPWQNVYEISGEDGRLLVRIWPEQLSHMEVLDGEGMKIGGS